METIFFDGLARRRSFPVQWKRIFQRMLHHGQWKRNFWLVETIFYKCFSRLLPIKVLFPSSGNAFLNKALILAIGEGFFLQWKFSTLLESFFLPAKTVTKREYNSLFKSDRLSGRNDVTLGKVNIRPEYCEYYLNNSFHKLKIQRLLQIKQKLLEETKLQMKSLH